jgi:hypothetical protein
VIFLGVGVGSAIVLIRYSRREKEPLRLIVRQVKVSVDTPSQEHLGARSS